VTTIAYRDGIIAADSCASDDQQRMRVTKLRKMGGYVFGFCGEWHSAHDFIAKFKGGTALSAMKVKGQLHTLILMPDGSCMRWENGGGAYPIEDKFAAIGTGAGYAIGAMELGATAVEAVRVACKYDPASAGPVRHKKTAA
jgi:hypothetical protein